MSRPIPLLDAQQQIIPMTPADQGYVSSYGGTANVKYTAYAAFGTLTTDAGWFIKNQTFDATGTTVRVRAALTAGIPDYVKEWDTTTSFTLLSLTKANPAVAQTDENHGFTTGDTIEIIGCDATEANGDGFGSVMFDVIVLSPDTFSLVDVNTGLDVDSSGWAAAGTTGEVFKRPYANHTFS